MTIRDLEHTLPNGFHDAVLNSYCVDLAAGSVRLTLNLWVGNIDSREYNERERYRSVEVILSGVSYFVTEVPDPRYSYSQPYIVDLCEPDPNVLERLPTPEGGYAGRFFSSTTNSFIHFAATDAHIIYTLETQPETP
jgi:hypothetical protein